MSRTWLLGLALILCVADCSGADGTAPAIERRANVIGASSLTIAGLPGELGSSPPSVQVFIPLGSGVPGVKVTFSFSDNRASDYSTVTDAQGFAVLENMRFDTRPGRYTITANVEGVGAVEFSVISLSGKVIATYDLRAVGGRSGPPFVFTDGEEVGELAGMHYQLFDDGTYRIGYVPKDQTDWSMPAPYKQRGDGGIEFYLDPSIGTVSGFYASRNYLFAVGTITGEVMKVAHEDSFDYEDEEYALSK